VKNGTVHNPKCKSDGRASGRTRSVDGTSDKIADAAAASGKSGETRPKRRCRRLSSYDETVDSEDQSSGSAEESVEHHLRRETVTVTDRRTTSRHQQVSETEKTAAQRCVAVLVTHHRLSFHSHFWFTAKWPLFS